MINTITTKIGQSVYMTELYDYLGLDKSQYSRFIKMNLIDNPYFDEGKDYSTVMSSENLGKRGRFRQEYYIHIDAAKKLCMVSKSAKGEQIRNELVQMTKQIENKALLSHQEIIGVIQMVKVFAVLEFRQKARDKHLDVFTNELQQQNPFTDRVSFIKRFYHWRGEMLSIGKEQVNLRLKEYCIANRLSVKRNLTVDDMLTVLGEYEQIKVAVWDILMSQKKGEEFAQNVALLAQDIAKQIRPQLERLNNDNLFFKRIEAYDIKAIGL